MDAASWNFSGCSVRSGESVSVLLVQVQPPHHGRAARRPRSKLHLEAEALLEQPDELAAGRAGAPA